MTKQTSTTAPTGSDFPQIITLGRLNIMEANNNHLESVYPAGYLHYFYLCLMPLDNTGSLVELTPEDVQGMIGNNLQIIKYYDDIGSSENVTGDPDPFFRSDYSFGLGDDCLFQYVGHFTRHNLLYIKVRTNNIASSVNYYEGFTLAASFENINGRWACNHNSGSGFDSYISFWQPPSGINPDGQFITFYAQENYSGASVTITDSGNLPDFKFLSYRCQPAQGYKSIYVIVLNSNGNQMHIDASQDTSTISIGELQARIIEFYDPGSKS
ncbi:hypothetical protein ACLEUK_19665 [Pseudescherichia vulneris]